MCFTAVERIQDTVSVCSECAWLSLVEFLNQHANHLAAFDFSPAIASLGHTTIAVFPPLLSAVMFISLFFDFCVAWMRPAGRVPAGTRRKSPGSLPHRSPPARRPPHVRCWTILSSRHRVLSGRSVPSAFGIIVRRAGRAR